MKRIIYLSYGSGPHQDEIAVSISTAWHWGDPSADGVQMTVYTDDPTPFTGLPVTVRPVPAATMDDWAGPHHFSHRRKIKVLQEAMSDADGPVVLVDGDTWWRKPPTRLFGRLGPKKSVLHIREGFIDEIGSTHSAKLAQFLASQPTGAHVAMWNAGVIGLDGSDGGVLDDVLALTDDFCSQGDCHTFEQLAFSLRLTQRGEVSEAADTVFHYWPPYLHQPFRHVLPHLSAARPRMSWEEWSALCWRHRPRPTAARRLKVVAKRALQAAGLLRGGARSNEW